MPKRLDGTQYEVGPLPAHLSCLHQALFSPPYPKLRDTVYCRRCQGYATVLAVADTYGVTCDRCQHLNKRYGSNLDAARRAASRHVMKFTPHTITIRKGEQVLERVTNSGAQEELPFAQVLSTRAALVKKHQKRLREVTAATNVVVAMTPPTEPHQER